MVKWVGYPREQATWEPKEHMNFLEDWPQYYKEVRQAYEAKKAKKQINKERNSKAAPKKDMAKTRAQKKKAKPAKAQKAGQKASASKATGLMPIEEVEEKSLSVEEHSIESSSEHESEQAESPVNVMSV